MLFSIFTTVFCLSIPVSTTDKFLSEINNFKSKDIQGSPSRKFKPEHLNYLHSNSHLESERKNSFEESENKRSFRDDTSHYPVENKHDYRILNEAERNSILEDEDERGSRNVRSAQNFDDDVESSHERRGDRRCTNNGKNKGKKKGKGNCQGNCGRGRGNGNCQNIRSLENSQQDKGLINDRNMLLTDLYGKPSLKTYSEFGTLDLKVFSRESKNPHKTRKIKRDYKHRGYSIKRYIKTGGNRKLAQSNSEVNNGDLRREMFEEEIFRPHDKLISSSIDQSAKHRVIGSKYGEYEHSTNSKKNYDGKGIEKYKSKEKERDDKKSNGITKIQKATKTNFTDTQHSGYGGSEIRNNFPEQNSPLQRVVRYSQESNNEESVTAVVFNEKQNENQKNNTRRKESGSNSMNSFGAQEDSEYTGNKKNPEMTHILKSRMSRSPLARKGERGEKIIMNKGSNIRPGGQVQRGVSHKIEGRKQGEGNTVINEIDENNTEKPGSYFLMHNSRNLKNDLNISNAKRSDNKDVNGRNWGTTGRGTELEESKLIQEKTDHDTVKNCHGAFWSWLFFGKGSSGGRGGNGNGGGNPVTGDDIGGDGGDPERITRRRQNSRRHKHGRRRVVDNVDKQT